MALVANGDAIGVARGVAAAVVAAAAALLARRTGALTGPGTVAAGVVGTLVLAGTGPAGGAVLAAFFVPATAVSRLVRGDTAAGTDAKGDCRDHWQVLANGGAPALGALAGLRDPALGLWLLTTGLAVASADTWATAWGTRSSMLPRHLVSGLPVPRGTSGGISPIGTGGALAGACVVALVGALAGRTPMLFPVAVVIGVAGMLADSALGATVQGRFRCPACDVASEWPVHRCGAGTLPEGGWSWLTNDGVNALATTLGLAAGWIAWLGLGPAR